MTSAGDDMDDIPGGQMRHRPLHFFWLLDCSGSMSMDGKIGQLNYAIRETIPEMRQVAGENPTASLLVRVLTFSTGAEWHIDAPTSIDDFQWSEVTAQGVTDMGRAFEMVAEQLQMPPMPQRALPPVLALVTDGQPTDDWKSGLARLDEVPWGRKAVRVAIAIGSDSSTPEALEVIKKFLRNPELEPLNTRNPKQLVRAIRWASTVAVQAASVPSLDSDQQTPTPSAPPIPMVASDDEDDVW